MVTSYYFFFISLTLLVCIVKGSSKWNHGYEIDDYLNLDLSTTTIDDSMLSLNTSSSSLCLLDKLLISWNASSFVNIERIGIAFMKSGSSTGSIVRLQDTVVMYKNTIDVLSCSNHNLIQCNIDSINEDNECIPKIDSILVRPDSNLLILVFEQETDQPKLFGPDDIHYALDIKPFRIIDPNVKGIWVSPTRLEIEINADFLQSILIQHQKGNKIEILVRQVPPDSYIIGSTMIRPMEHGSYQIAFVNMDSNSIILPRLIRSIQVVICDDDITVIPGSSTDYYPSNPTHSSSSSVSSNSKKQTKMKTVNKLLHLQGVLAITGKSPIKLAHTAFPSIFNSGTWSYSCWIRIIEPSTNIFRSILYKGDSYGFSRTPSIWLHPDSHKLSIRVSTIDNPDIGADSINALPHNEWVYVSIVFQNSSSPSSQSRKSTGRNKSEDLFNGLHMTYPVNYYKEEEGSREENNNKSIVDDDNAYEYRISLYINGQLDIDMQFSSMVVGNSEPLHLFKDISHDGPKAFVRDLTIWDRDLTSAEVKAEYLSGSWDHSNDLIDHTLGLFELADNKVVYSMKDNDDTNIIRYNTFNDVTILEEEFTDLLEDEAVDPIAGILLEKAKASAANCEAFATRLDLYTESAEHGSAEALYLWGMMTKYGTEAGNTQCGAEDSYDSKSSYASSFLSSASSSLTRIMSQASSSAGGDSFLLSQDQATYAFLYAAEMGHVPAIFQLALILLHGTGASPLISNPLQKVPVTSIYIPVPPRFIVTPSHQHGHSDKMSGIDSMNKEAYYGLTKLHFMIMKYLLESNTEYFRNIHQCKGNFNQSLGKSHFNLGSSVIDDLTYTNEYTDDIERIERNSTHVTSETISSTRGGCSSSRKGSRMNATSLAIGMIHLSALHNIPEAHQALAYRYKNGMGVNTDLETSLFYLQLPAIVTNEEFHRIGGQPVVENDRINDKTAPEISKGNQGLTDELIQHQIVRAQEGHLPSILAMGDLYYYGARGLPRDQPLALRYFEQAVEQHGDPIGMCGAAGMYLKGEGTTQNITRAISLYENASSLGSIRALNGLGYMYFYGQSVPKNASKAFQYFLMAAAYETDADSIFNAGHCLEHGIGTDVNLTKAIDFYSFAANRLGDFNAIQSLGHMSSEGRGIERSATIAWSYLNVATTVGPWSGWVRRGLDQYFQKKYQNSLSCYLYAGELGLEVSQSNAAYILRSKLSTTTTSIAYPKIASSANYSIGCFGTSTADSSYRESCVYQNKPESNRRIDAPVTITDQWNNRLQRRQYELSSYHNNKDSLMHIGNCYFKAQCGVKRIDYNKAIYYYKQASHAGHSLSSAYLAVINQFGIGVIVNKERAERYYQLALKQKELDQQETDQFILQTLKYALSMNNYNILTPINYIMERTVKLLWNM